MSARPRAGKALGEGAAASCERWGFGTALVGRLVLAHGNSVAHRSLIGGIGTMGVSPEDPRVAVVMITHNRAHEVMRSLDELARLPERPRIVLVDNDSKDGTSAAVAERFPQVEILEAG